VKIAAPLFLLLSGLAMARADAPPANQLANGDFKDGMKSWNGEFHVMAAADRVFSGGIDLSKGASGVVAHLGNDSSQPDAPVRKWYGIYQMFSSLGAALDFSVTYQVSDDYQPKDTLPPEGQSLISFDLTNPRDYFERFSFPKPSNPVDTPSPDPHIVGPDFALILYDIGTRSFISSSIHPTVGSIRVQTSSGTLNVRDGGNKVVFIIFKEGEGTVALYNVSVARSYTPRALAPLGDKSDSIPKVNISDPGQMPDMHLGDPGSISN
jgi:hypothetical protein